MHCHEVEPLLVAWHDGELAPSATVQVEEHLSDCSHCVHHSQRLLAATPEPWASAPAEVQHRLAEAVDVDLVLAEAERLGPATTPWRVPRWLTEPREVSPVALLAYAALLGASLGWGWMNWLATGHPVDPVAGAHPGAPAADVIPADAYAPASYTPPERQEQPGEEDAHP